MSQVYLRQNNSPIYSGFYVVRTCFLFLLFLFFCWGGGGGGGGWCS